MGGRSGLPESIQPVVFAAYRCEKFKEECIWYFWLDDWAGLNLTQTSEEEPKQVYCLLPANVEFPQFYSSFHLCFFFFCLSEAKADRHDSNTVQMFISNTRSLPALYDLWIEDQFDALMTKDSLQQNSETVSENEFSQCDPHLKASPSHMNQYTSQLSFWIKFSLKIFFKNSFIF